MVVIKDNSNQIQFSQDQLWKHKDGSMEVISTMPTNKIKQVILPEINKRLVEKRNSVALFSKKRELCVETLLSRGIVTEDKDLSEELLISQLLTIDISILEKAMEMAIERYRNS